MPALCSALSTPHIAPDLFISIQAEELKKVTTKEGGDFDETPYKALAVLAADVALGCGV